MLLPRAENRLPYQEEVRCVATRICCIHTHAELTKRDEGRSKTAATRRAIRDLSRGEGSGEMITADIPPANQSYNSASGEHSLSSTTRKVHTGFAVALACLVLVGMAANLSVKGLTDSARWVDHTHE